MHKLFYHSKAFFNVKILLINPPLSAEEQHNPVVANLFSNAMPLGILYIASYSIERGLNVRAIDAPAERLSLDETMARIKKFSPDLIGITTTTPVFHRAIALARAIKVWAPKLPIVVGGPHINAAPITSMLHDCFDIGCIGEGEETFYELATALGRGESPDHIHGLIFRHSSGSIRFSPPRAPLMNLDLLPFPARHLLNSKLYTSLPTDVQYLPKFTVLATRGCPFRCTYCDHASEGEKYRTASPTYMVNELEMLEKQYGAREVAFVGSTFTAKREKAIELCNLILERGLKLKWTCSTRVDVVNEELLRLMKRAGCWSIRFGVESGNQKILNFIQKGITKEQVTEAINLCEKVGICTKAFFMVGHPGETIQTMEETIDFACSLPLTDITVQINTPLPNTHQYAIAKDYGTIPSVDYSKYSFFSPVFIPHGLTKEDLAYYHKEFYRRFFWRVPTIKRQLKKVAHFATLMNYLRCLDLIFYLTLDVFKRPSRHQTINDKQLSSPVGETSDLKG